MARPLKGTKESEIARLKWRKTMEERHGNVTEFMRKVGARGGAARVPKGFATNPYLASVAGQIGGRKSRRKSKPKDVADVQ